MADRNAARLLRLVDDLLLLARLGSGADQLELERVDLAAAAAQSGLDATPDATRRNIVVVADSEGPLWVNAEPSAWPRCSTTCSATPSSIRCRSARYASRPGGSVADASSRCPTTVSASPRTSCLLSPHGTDGHMVRGLRACADDYLTKPFGNAELVARIQTLSDTRGPSPNSSAFPRSSVTRC